ncbi:lymphocyte antigen 6 complex locus protein G5b [Dasypus novemcinctus]|uniref:lymphocyte antigen 6 complex locus protein G5b n=1 Tax=Dasypus novemcinctus TaxID=9361 RepID=UPI0003291452|nr:lymphocyte antigen 6 complex locus protein G5b [Dasypus novemcinctus]
MVTGKWGFRAPARECPSPQNSTVKVHVLVGMLVMVGFSVGKAPAPKVRTCHFCLLEDPSVGCISGSEKCTVSRPAPCMVITIFRSAKVRFIIRGCGQYNSYRCQEKRNTYFAEYWYHAQCCQYDYCNSWSSPQLQNSPPEASDRPLALPLPEPQIHQLYQALDLSLPLPSFHAGQEPEGLEPLSLGVPVADLRRTYLFLNSSGLLVLPRAGP